MSYSIKKKWHKVACICTITNVYSATVWPKIADFIANIWQEMPITRDYKCKKTLQNIPKIIYKTRYNNTEKFCSKYNELLLFYDVFLLLFYHHFAFTILQQQIFIKGSFYKDLLLTCKLIKTLIRSYQMHLNHWKQ